MRGGYPGCGVRHYSGHVACRRVFPHSLHTFREGTWQVCVLVPPRPRLTPPASPPEREVCVLRKLRSVSAREGDGATFECTVSEAEIPGRWELGGRALRPGNRVRIRQEGLAAFLPPVTRCYLAHGSGTLRPIRISSASSSSRPRPTAPRSRSLGLSFRRHLRVLPNSFLLPRSNSTHRHFGTSLGPTRVPPSFSNPPGKRLRPCYLPLPPGKKHILVLRELRAEDTGEVCFQAGPAQSLARLEVEGKLLRQRGQGRASSPVLGLTDWPQVLEMPLPSSLLFEEISWGRSQRAAQFLRRRRRGRDFEPIVQRN